MIVARLACRLSLPADTTDVDLTTNGAHLLAASLGKARAIDTPTYPMPDLQVHACRHLPLKEADTPYLIPLRTERTALVEVAPLEHPMSTRISQATLMVVAVGVVQTTEREMIAALGM